MQIVNLTEAAAARIRALEEKARGKVVRLKVGTKGCSGHSYEFECADAPGASDELVERDGARLFVDPLSLIFVAGTTVDWRVEGLNEGFAFDNPNEVGRCGCGESFQV